MPFPGGAQVTIWGPAAGLAPALLVGMLTFGSGDLATGNPLLLGAIVGILLGYPRYPDARQLIRSAVRYSHRHRRRIVMFAYWLNPSSCAC